MGLTLTTRKEEKVGKQEKQYVFFFSVPWTSFLSQFMISSCSPLRVLLCYVDAQDEGSTLFLPGYL